MVGQRPVNGGESKRSHLLQPKNPACLVVSGKPGNVDLLQNSFGEIVYVSPDVGKNKIGIVKIHDSDVPLARRKKSVDTVFTYSQSTSAAGLGM